MFDVIIKLTWKSIGQMMTEIAYGATYADTVITLTESRISYSVGEIGTVI